MGAGAAAAEVPVLGYIAVGLLAAAMFCVFVGLRAGWENTFGGLFHELAKVSIPTGFFGSIHPLGFLDDANKAVLNALAYGIQHSEHAMGYLFHGAAVIQGWIARELLDLARETYGWMEWFQHAHLPRWVKALVYALVPPLLAPLVARAIAHLHPGAITRVVVGKIGLTRRQVRAMIAAALATAGAVALPLPHVLPRLRSLERDRANIWRRLRKLEKLLAAAGAAALVARAFGLSSVRCVRDGNLGKLARRWCGLESLIADALLADLAITGSAISLVELAKVTQKAAPAVATSLAFFIDDLPIAVADAERMGKRALQILEDIA